eukprot:gnl/Chilomastix_cuspidata/2516.p1 GENE.gnl/Chilomastix_cuspidata/2516~~gnl/Chilomastix_cuspidata/2516.p1  ORF type:complete len:560 (+),score=146.99 gnl/Chilomastix_cuspidata/2516:738-2417(+)
MPKISFVSKRGRNRIREEKNSKKQQQVEEMRRRIQSYAPQQIPNTNSAAQIPEQTPFQESERLATDLQTPKSRYKFSWDADEDTSKDSLFGQEVARAVRRRSAGADPLLRGGGRSWREKLRGEMTARDWRIFCEDHQIYMEHHGAVQPCRSWDEMDLMRSLLHSVKALGFAAPTPVQMASVPLVLSRRDLVATAETGSGKTLAFVAPLMEQLISVEPRNFRVENGPLCMILAPTRPLARQIADMATQIGRHTRLRVAYVVGGLEMGLQIVALRKGVHILVGTPGRLISLIREGHLLTGQVRWVVLDEADEMISLGFEEQLRDVLASIPSVAARARGADPQPEAPHEVGDLPRAPQLLMFSATMPPAVRDIALSYMRAPATVRVGRPGEAVQTVRQEITWVSPEQKERQLVHTLRRVRAPGIIFVNFIKLAESLGKALSARGFAVTVLHGKLKEERREAALREFAEEHRTDFLVSTDLAGRGIDVPGLQTVVNFDCPNKIETYTHRIGRTGRAGARGYSMTFVNEGDAEVLPELCKALTRAGVSLPPQLKPYYAFESIVK